MLTKADIEFIKRNREQITRNRTVPVILWREEETGKDPFTGRPIYEEVPEEVEATWSSITSQSGGEGELIIVNGVQAETDDVIANIDIKHNIDGVTRITHGVTGVRYRIRARDQLGLGELNRHYLLLKKVL